MLTRRARVSTATLAGVLLLSACTHQEPEPPQPTTPIAPPEAEVPPGPRDGGTLRIGMSTEPGSLDPRFLVDGSGELIVDALFDPLVRIVDGDVVPAAARSWEIDDDGRVFRFRLREAVFHDGEPVTAHDFVRSFRRIADGTQEPASFLAYLLEAVEGAEHARDGVPLRGVEAIDDRTLEIRLSESDPGFLTALSDPSLVPLPGSADRDLEAFAMQPIGNGPFAMAGPRELGGFVRLTRFAEHADPAYLDEVVFTMYDDLRGIDGQWSDLLAGQLHVADLSPNRREEAEQRFGTSSDGYAGPGVLDGITSSIYLYGIDTTVEPFDDPRVRRAISLAIDREALAEDVMQGTRAPATSLVPPVLDGYRPAVCSYCRHDPEKAAALWAEVRDESTVEEEGDEPQSAASSDDTAADGGSQSGAGAQSDEAEDAQADGDGPQQPDEADGSGDGGDVPDPQGDAASDGGDEGSRTDGTEPGPPLPERLTLTHTRGDTHAAIAEQMATDIASALDIDVDFQARDLATMIQAVREGEVPIFRLGWELTTPDPAAYLRPLFHSSQIGLDNLARYASPRVDELLDKARASDDAQDRARQFRSVERQVLTDLPVLPLLWYRHAVVVSDDVRDLVYSPLGRMNLAEVWFEDPGA